MFNVYISFFASTWMDGQINEWIGEMKDGLTFLYGNPCSVKYIITLLTALSSFFSLCNRENKSNTERCLNYRRAH